MASLVLAVLVLALLLLSLLLAVPTLLIIEARKDGPKTSLELAVGPLAGKLKLRVFELPAGEATRSSHGQSGRLSELLQTIVARRGHASSGARKLPRRVALVRRAVRTAWWAIKQPGCYCTKLDIQLRLSLDDASAAALATGLAHAAFAVSQSILMNSVHFARGVQPQFHLEPSYEGTETSGAVDCIFSIPIGYIIGRGVARLLRLRLSPEKVA